GLTYSPPSGLMDILDKLSALYKHRRNEIETEAASRSARERELLRTAGSEAGIDHGAVDEVAASILASWDKGYGGLGDEPKFPPFDALELALARYAETGDPVLRSFVVSTLDGMSVGELFDRVEGGFFRYATRRDWSAPHYEKMLSDNADLISIYLAASTVLGRPDYTGVARRTIEYVLENLADDERRGFFGSQDADETYYHRGSEERSRAVTPAVDRTIYTDSSSRMISALVQASAVLSDPDLLQVAERAADFMWKRGFKHGEGVCHYFELPEGSPHLWGQPADQVFFLGALTDLYQATSEPHYLERAAELGEALVRLNKSDAGWLAVAGLNMAGEDGRGSNDVLSEVPLDFPDIGLNGHGARALLVLDALAPGKGFREAAEGILSSLSERYRSYSYFASSYALAVEIDKKGLIEVRVNGDHCSDSGWEIVRAAIAAFNPRKVVRPESVEDFFVAGEGAPTPPAVVCCPGQCRPAYDADELKDVLASIAVDDVRC
ncbi:MAG: thioredoxin domain-containing protein, partial [Actinobacteria bacterium]|nr:thioredoxin domain-containing protein [Actinomycetota bacterium]